MIWFIYALGVATGAGGYYLYDRFFSTVKQLGKALLNRAGGDASAAWAHVRKLV